MKYGDRTPSTLCRAPTFSMSPTWMGQTNLWYALIEIFYKLPGHACRAQRLDGAQPHAQLRLRRPSVCRNPQVVRAASGDPWHAISLDDIRSVLYTVCVSFCRASGGPGNAFFDNFLWGCGRFNTFGHLLCGFSAYQQQLLWMPHLETLDPVTPCICLTYKKSRFSLCAPNWNASPPLPSSPFVDNPLPLASS
jgi:hypothetical protein